jgi:hypothetical protein
MKRFKFRTIGRVRMMVIHEFLDPNNFNERINTAGTRETRTLKMGIDDSG